MEKNLSKHPIIKKAIAQSKQMLADAKIVIGSEYTVELSHHYGLDNFYKHGLVLINLIDREYCKKLLIVMPGQSHPEHYHVKKEETFHILSGNLSFEIDGKIEELRPGDLKLITEGVRHSFWSKDGCIIEEISTRYVKGGSIYADLSILNGNPDNRKTYIGTFEQPFAKKEVSVSHTPSPMRKYPNSQSQLSSILSFINSKPKQTLLEIDCDQGHLAHDLSKAGHIVHTVDSKNDLHYPSLQPLFSKIDMSFQHLPFKPKTFDGVYCINSVTSIANLSFLFEEVQRVLKQHGWFVFTVSNTSNLYSRLIFFVTGEIASTSLTKVNIVTPQLIHNLTESFFGAKYKIYTIPHKVKVPILRVLVGYNPLFADSVTYLIKMK